MIWRNDANGNFKVSFIFRSKEKGPCPLWSKAWIKGLTPKINIFFWILLQKKILTQDNLQKRGINVVNWCCLCKKDLEDSDHLFLNYNYSQNVWNYILKFWIIAWVHHNKIKQCFQSWICPNKDNNVEFLWKITLPHLWWGIWKERNAWLGPWSKHFWCY